MLTPPDDDIPVIPATEGSENWLHSAGRDIRAASAVEKARALATKLRDAPSPKALSRPTQGRRTKPKTRTPSSPTETLPISSASAEQLALTLLGPSDGRER